LSPTRYHAFVDRLRASLAGKTGQALSAALDLQIEESEVPVLATDSAGRYIAANSAAERLTGFSRTEILGMSVIDLTPPPSADDGRQLWAEFVTNGEQRGTYDVRRRGAEVTGVRYWAFANVAPGIHVSVLVPNNDA
jgi:PAS domain S-box-containing protein